MLTMKKLLIAFLVMACFASCSENDTKDKSENKKDKAAKVETFKVNINLKNIADKTVYLQRFDGETMQKLDSIFVKDSIAVFTVEQSKNTDAYNIMINGWRGPLMFFADNKDVKIKGDYQDSRNIKIEASQSQENLNRFNSEIGKLDDEELIYYTVLSFVKENANSSVAPYILYRYKWDFELGDLERIYNEVLPENMQSAYKEMLLKYIKDLHETEPGQPFKDFTQKDVDGNDFTLSSVVGKSKVVILDFWASWCPDCRKENPNLVAVYKKYKNKGLEIVSVSLDTDVEAWKKAIKDDKLTWKHHVSDLQRWKNAAAELYTISFIPQNIIIGQDGKILEKNLTGDKLKDFIGSILK